WLILGPGLAVITVVIITVLAILIILMLRKALIVLLIVVSPIAFVLYLLPNTEKFFSKWMKMFGQLLMVFPVVGLLFGAGQLASTIILVSGATVPTITDTKTCDASTPTTNTSTGGIGGSAGSGTLNNVSNSGSYDGKCDGYINISGTRANPGDAGKNLNGKAASWTLGLVAVGVAVAPLMAVYAVLKGALSAAGAIGGTLSSMAQKGRGAGSRATKGFDERRQKRFGIQALGDGRRAKAINAITAGQYRRRAKRSAIDNGLEGELKRAQQKYVADQIGKDSGLAEKIAGGGILTGASEAGTQRAIAGAQLTIQRATAEAIEAESILLRGAGLDQLRSQAAGGAGISEAQQIAAAQMVVNNADYEGINQLVDKFSASTASNARELRIALSEALQKSSSRPAYLSQGALAELRTGAKPMDSQALVRNSIENNTYAPEVMARTSKDELSLVGDIALNDAGVSGAAKAGFVNNAASALSDPQLERQLSKNKEVITAIAGASRPRSSASGASWIP
ncbi:hypothetical protein KDA14_03950, partial [Candidatus Saccharibacteria bacterium]|nr:hypothetical protein [Candidatus Saccharibacteria bacterium]